MQRISRSVLASEVLGSRALVAGAVLLGHLMLVVPLALRSAAHLGPVPSPSQVVMAAQIFVQSTDWDRVPVPQVPLETLPTPEPSLTQIQFTDSLEDESPGVTGPASAPRLSHFQTADVTTYARRAHVRAGHPITVVLVVTVGEDGRAGSVDVRRGSGNANIDAAAVDYALALRWIPGTRNQQPRSMRVLLPVVLSTPS
jgi:TonB family protein